ncbi:MAG: hypothetical protein WC070_00495 [Candidatus Magasanikbacteria bacterium]
MLENFESKAPDYQVEHLPDYDIVLNMDYGSFNDQAHLLKTLRGSGSIDDKIDQLKKMREEDGELPYFIKQKKYTAKAIAKGIAERQKFKGTAEIGFRSVLNEILLSKRIKEIIASDDAQKIVRKWGFEGLRFVDPIAGVVARDGRKFLVYKNIKSKEVYEFETEGSFDLNYGLPTEVRDDIESKLRNLYSITAELKKVFFDNGIHANDIRDNQFMLTKQGDKYFLNLIDVEAYRKIT